MKKSENYSHSEFTLIMNQWLDIVFCDLRYLRACAHRHSVCISFNLLYSLEPHSGFIL